MDYDKLFKELSDGQLHYALKCFDDMVKMGYPMSTYYHYTKKELESRDVTELFVD